MKTDKELEEQARKVLPNPEKSNAAYYRVLIPDVPEIKPTREFLPPPRKINDTFVIFTRRVIAGSMCWVLQRIDR